VLGAQSSPCLDEGDFQLSATYRQFTADEQFRGGSDLNPAVTSLNTQVISKMKFAEIDGIYALNQQLNLTIGVPYILKASSNRALPATVAGSPRFEHSTSGIGDITLGGRYWLFDCDDSPDQNIGLGLSLKIPSGDSHVQDLFPNGAGQDIRLRDVDQSIQPGDGGWGFVLSGQAYKAVGDFTLFASGAYLFNPRGQNNTLSAPAFLNPAGPQAVAANIRYNTVPDSYIFQAGLGYPLAILPGLSISLAGRIDGSPENDVFGKTTGFRRPGYFVTMVPGINYSTEKATFSINIPTRIYQYVHNSLGTPRDSTFANYLIEASVSYRFGE
jgi:hypothetical protein